MLEDTAQYRFTISNTVLLVVKQGFLPLEGNAVLQESRQELASASLLSRCWSVFRLI
jgi:hypothetical protein